MQKFSFGSDPEFPLKTKSGKLKSAIPVVVATSDNRAAVNGHEFYHDNVNVEMSIKPGNTKEETINNFREAIQTAAEMVLPFHLVTQAYSVYPDSELEDLDARVVGCSPEYCAYRLRMIEPPLAAIEGGNTRTAGGHVHLGGEDDSVLRDNINFFMVARVLDLLLGIPSLFMDHDPTSPQRRAMYGLAGSHRWKPYGLEYRALSNFWLASPKLVSLVWDVCEQGIDFVAQGKHLEFWSIDRNKMEEGEDVVDCIAVNDGYDEAGVCEAINSFDREKAKTFLPLVKKHLPAALYGEVEKAFKPVSYDLYKEWDLQQ